MHGHVTEFLKAQGPAQSALHSRPAACAKLHLHRMTNARLHTSMRSICVQTANDWAMNLFRERFAKFLYHILTLILMGCLLVSQLLTARILVLRTSLATGSVGPNEPSQQEGEEGSPGGSGGAAAEVSIGAHTAGDCSKPSAITDSAHDRVL